VDLIAHTRRARSLMAMLLLATTVGSGVVQSTTPSAAAQTPPAATPSKTSALKGIDPNNLPTILMPTSTYKVTVTFNSLTVHDTHEGVLSGDGEYDLVVYVQGTKINLTDASGPGDGLWDVSEGETVSFRPGTELTVDLPPTTPLLIFTVGSEVDECGRTDFYNSTWKWLFGPGAHEPTLLDNAKSLQKELNYHSQFGWHERGPECKHDDGLNYPLNTNDILGVITKIYEAPSYGAGAHTNVVSSTGDFTLRYTITVTPPPGKLPT
jgi:hypothetical protein